MSIINPFISSARYPTPPAGVSALGRFYDKKNSVSFSTDITFPLGDYKVSKFSVDIDKKDKSAPSNAIHKPEDVVERLEGSDVTSNKYLRLCTISSSSGSHIQYDFTNGNEYRILYEIYITHTAENNAKTYYRLEHIQNFKFFATPVSLSDFSFDPNVQVGDKITVSGLRLLTGSAPDSTEPEATSDYDAVQFTFQEVEAETGVTLNNQSTEPYIVDLPYNALGNYTLPHNTLTNGKIYRVDVEENWALGFSAHQRSSQPLYILNRPQIAAAGIDVKGLSVHHANNVVVSINMNDLVPSGAVAIPSTIWFEFINSNNVLVAKTAAVTPSGNLYAFKLNQIDIVSNGGILIDNQYSVKAVVQYPNGSSPPHERRSDAVNVTFDLVKPSIKTITPYDVQNDGGNDGVFHSDSTDVDTSNQIIATVAVDNVAYELYAPSMIKFNIYNLSDTQLAETKEYTFKNSLGVGSQPYNIQLDEITLLGGALALTNGTPYRVKAAVSLLDHDSTPNPEWRLSASFTSVQFHQNVAPVPSVTISNSWALATDNVPSSSEARFNASPLVGVSGYFILAIQNTLMWLAPDLELNINSMIAQTGYLLRERHWVRN